MAGMGPPPKPADQRRSRVKPMANTLKLPACGRPGPAPEWPFPKTPMTPDEKEIWEYIWKGPQAVAWERNGSFRAVARYTRCLVLAERHGATPAQLTEARHHEDRLGLTPLAMLRLRWEVAADEVGEARQDKAASRTVDAIDPNLIRKRA